MGAQVLAVPAQSSQQLLDAARADLAAGRAEIAQRRLEQLIATFPDDTPAAEARRELYSLYGADREIASEPSGRRPAPTAVPEAVPARRSENDSVDTGSGRWRTSTFAAATLQDDLRSTTGDRVFFSAGSSELGARARVVLAAQADWLRRHRDVVAIVEGHADAAEAGAPGHGVALGRAVEVIGRLVAEGVEPERLRFKSFDAAEPVAMCDDSDCAAQNRRAVVRVEPWRGTRATADGSGVDKDR